jgi:hypothetical protein
MSCQLFSINTPGQPHLMVEKQFLVMASPGFTAQQRRKAGKVGVRGPFGPRPPAAVA